MAITLTGSGGLFTRLGKLFGAWRAIVDAMDAYVIDVDGIADEYDGETRNVLGPLIGATAQLTGSIAAPFSYIRSAAQNTLVEMANDDNPLPGKTVQNAVSELIDQMTASGDSVKANVVTASASAGSGNAGTGGAVVTIQRTAAQKWENAFAEDIVVKVVTDGQVDTAYEGVEVWSIAGAASNPTSDRRWPRDGSATVATTRTVCGSTDASANVAANKTTNGDFETFTVANTPDNWLIVTGAAGTDIFDSATALRGAHSLRLQGDGATLVALRQEFGNPSYTAARLRPNAWHALSFWTRHNGAAPAAGVCRVSLQDGSGTVLWSSSVSFNANTLTGSFVQKSVAFLTGADVPSTVRLVVEQTTAIDAGKGWIVDELCVAEMQQVYAGGPHVAIFAGATSFVVNDRYTLAVANDHGGKFQTDFERFMGTNALGLLLPSATGGAETIADTLVS